MKIHTTTKITYFENSNQIETSCEIDSYGVKQGKYIHYWLNGKIQETSNFKNGVYNGILTRYYADGTLSSKRKMVNGGQTKQIF